jgi:hypothetical protein
MEYMEYTPRQIAVKKTRPTNGSYVLEFHASESLDYLIVVLFICCWLLDVLADTLWLPFITDRASPASLRA